MSDPEPIEVEAEPPDVPCSICGQPFLVNQVISALCVGYEDGVPIFAMQHQACIDSEAIAFNEQLRDD